MFIAQVGQAMHRTVARRLVDKGMVPGQAELAK